MGYRDCLSSIFGGIRDTQVLFYPTIERTHGKTITLATKEIVITASVVLTFSLSESISPLNNDSNSPKEVRTGPIESPHPVQTLAVKGIVK